MRATTSRRRRRIVTTLLAFVVTTSAAACTDDSSEGPQYQPAAAEQEMFTHLLQATQDQSEQASSALGILRYDWHDEEDYDVYVAQSSFRTVHTAHPMVVLMAPGAQWLGGPLGQITLVFRVTDDQYEHWNQSPETLRRIQEYSWATVVYDPLCRAFNYGFATLEACESSPEERRAATVDEHLVPMEPLDFDTYRIGRYNPEYEDLDWTTPTADSTALSPPAAAWHNDESVIFVTALREGQQLTGGELGSRLVLLPTLQRVYFGEQDFEEYPVIIEDVISWTCSGPNGIRSYLGPEVIARYPVACAS